jgi:hypothetical protein
MNSPAGHAPLPGVSSRRKSVSILDPDLNFVPGRGKHASASGLGLTADADGSVMLAQGASPHPRACDDDSLCKKLKGQHTSVQSPPHSSATATAGAGGPQLPDPAHHHSTASKIFNICASLERAASAGQAAAAPLAAAIKTVQDAVAECDVAEMIASPPPIALPPVPNTAADLLASLRTKVASAKAAGALSGAFVDNSCAGNGAAAAAPAESYGTYARSVSPPDSVAVMQNEINRGLTCHGSDEGMRSTVAGPNITAPSSRSANIPVPVRHARAAVLCASTSPSHSALRNNFWTLLSGEQPPMALVHSFRSVIEPEISGRKRVWVRAQDADPLCYLSLIFSRANVPPIALFSAIDGSMQSDFMDSVYMSGIDVFLLPFDLDPFLGMAAADSDTSQTCALILSTLISLLQHIATLCVRHAANGDFVGPSIILAGMCSKDVIDSHIPILRLVSDTFYDMLKGSFVSLGLIECALDASSCLWFHPVSSSSPHGSFAIQDALCSYLYSPAGSSFTLPQHWFHLLTALRQSTQPAVPMSTVHSLAAECFALDVPSSNFEDELQRFLSFVAEQGVAWRSSSAPDLFVMDGPLLAWQTAAAVMHHGSTVLHPGQHAQSTSRRSHQQAYHSFLLTGHLSSVLLNSFFSSEALANHTLPILIACGLIVPLCSSEKSQLTGTSTSFAVLSMMPKVSSEKLQLQLATSFAPCLSLICFIFTCDAPPRAANPSTVPSPSVFALRASPLLLIPSLWSELRSMVLDELKLGMDSIVMSSSVFACVAAAPFSIEHDSHNQFFRLRLHGVARDMLLSRISCCFSRAVTVFPFISYNFSIDSSQFSSCATLPPVLFSLRKMIECAASGKAFHHSSASIAAEEVDLVFGNSYRDSPWITVHVVYSTASLHFARAVCRDLSLSHVSGVAVHCLMVRAAPFMLPDTELIHVINEANHVIFFAEQEELAGALHSQPHSIFASQLLTLRHLLSQNPSLSFSSYVLRNSAHSPAAPNSHKSHSVTVDDSLASLLASSDALQSASPQGVHDVITRIFLSSERLQADTSASALVSSSSLMPSQVSAVSRAVLERLHLLSLLQPSLKDASIFQKEFSSVTLESDSAFHLMSSIELDISAMSRTNASATMSLPNHQSPAAAYANVDYGVAESSDNDDNGGYGTDDEYDNEIVGESGDDFVDRSVPPRPPTPPDEDEVLQLQSLILSLSAPLSARPAVDSAAAGMLLPVLDTSIHCQLPRADKAALQHESPASPPQAASKSNGVKFADEANLSIEFNSPSDPPKIAFLKKGSGSLRQKQRQIDGAIPRVNSSPKQPRASDFAPTVPTILSRSSISPVISPSSSKSSPHVGISSPELEQSSRQASSMHPPTARSPVSRAPATAHYDPYPPDAHPRLTLLLPELCFDRSAGAANRVISSWLDHEGRISINRSRAMRLVCLCEMHVARPLGPTSSPLILWHRCSHLGFPVAASKGRDPSIFRSPLFANTRSFSQFQMPFVPARRLLEKSSQWPVSLESVAEYSAAPSTMNCSSAIWLNGTTPTFS